MTAHQILCSDGSIRALSASLSSQFREQTADVVTGREDPVALVD